MYAVSKNIIQHFPAQNLSNFKNGDYLFFDDDGNKIDDSEVDNTAEEEIKAHSVTVNINSAEALNASLIENGFSPGSLMRTVPFSDSYNPIKKITDYVRAGADNG